MLQYQSFKQVTGLRFYHYCFRFARQTECFTHFLRKDATDLRLKVDHSDIKKKKKKVTWSFLCQEA